jgi:hypothetical protein
MTDKVKKSARQVQEATGLPYTICKQLVQGALVWTSRSDECLVASALSSALRWAAPKPDAAIKPCRCSKCAPTPPDAA